MKRYWGHDNFRPQQAEIINSVMQGHDTLVLFPTGGGKSICYQIPALMREGLCLVISPLIALMKDQVAELSKRGIKAACLYAGMTGNEQEIIFNKCINGKIKLLYISPERLQRRVFIEHFRQMKVSLIAVDEAHCISQWGHDFRPDYLKIAKIRDYAPATPIIALTATATAAVVEDIKYQLALRNCQYFHASFERRNLSYMVFHETDKSGRLLRILRKVNGCSIIYVRNRRRTVEIARYLVQNGLPAAYYHAGLDIKERDIAQMRWMKGEVQIIVATNAFGMGINKPDVRCVIHLDIPTSVEEYFQEAGRAGRDGKKSYAVVLYNDNDIENLQETLDISFPTQKRIASTYQALCNFYQLPIGSGEDCQFDFNIEALCSIYHIGVVEFFSATRFLEREGLIMLPQQDEALSKVHIPISYDVLYQFQVAQPRYSDLITLLLRQSEGVFSDFVPISEKKLAKMLLLEEEHVRNRLLHLHELKIIEYKPKKKQQQIIFTSPCIPSKDLTLTESHYKELKKQAQKRLEAIREYVTDTKTCRSQKLIAYFGDAVGPCGGCDVCLSQKKASSEEIRGLILKLLQQPMQADQLLTAMGDVNEKDFRKVLRQMVDEKVVSINENLEFFV